MKNRTIGKVTNMTSMIIPDNPWQKVQVAFAFTICCAIISVIWMIMMGVKSVYAENMKCPPGNKICFIAVHKTTKKEMCRHNDNNPWQWVLDQNGNKISCSVEEVVPTNTLRPIVITYTAIPPTDLPKQTLVPTNTPFVPDPTEVKPTHILPSPTRRPANQEESSNIALPTPTCTIAPLGVSSTECPWCDIVWIIARSQQTMAASMATLAARTPSP